MQDLAKSFEASGVPTCCAIREIEESYLPLQPDGIFHTFIYYPDLPGKKPTIVMRSCYPNSLPFLQAQAEGFCKRGYIVAFQFCRGTGGSTGEWEPNVHEREDGLKFIHYLSTLDEVGDMGYMGSSYLALTGWAMADAVPDQMKTMYLTHYGTSRYTSAYKDGLFRHDILTAWAIGNAGFPIGATSDESALYRPHIQVDEALWGRAVPWYRDYVTHTNQSDDYWQTGFWKELEDIPSKVKLPLYIGTGWYDHHFESTMATYSQLSEASKAKSLLRIGAWKHNFGPCVDDMVQEHLENDDTKMALLWFERVLKKGEYFAKRFEAYTIGEDRWEDYSQFPIPTQEERTLYLQPGMDGARGGLGEAPVTAPYACYYFNII